jgi:hypothetical protein
MRGLIEVDPTHLRLADLRRSRKLLESFIRDEAYTGEYQWIQTQQYGFDHGSVRDGAASLLRDT